MESMRRHKRYGLDLIDVKGKMSLSEKVEILDISLGGVAFKADRRLNPGREYMINLQDQGKILNVMGKIVRSEFSGTEARDNCESVSIYSASMQFKDGSTDQVAEFLKSVIKKHKETTPSLGGRRHNARFHNNGPLENILCYPADFKVKTISLSGMLIRTDQALEIESRVPMGLPLYDGTTVNFTGRIVTCQRKEAGGQTYYDIGSEFIDLTDKNITLLQTFIDQWTTMENNIERESEQAEGRT